MGTTNSYYEAVNPQDLKAHPDNEAIFGPVDKELASDTEFLESIKRSGVTTPVTITPDGRVLSGHRRLAAAIRCNQQTVPAIVVRDLSEHDQERLWLEANLQRQMTTEQRARWFKRLRNLESQPASDRKQAGVAVNSPGGRSADIAAEKVGMSRQTATRAATVTDVIDKAEASGDHERADKLRTALNEVSVSSAYRMAAQAMPDNAEPEFDETADVRTFTPSEAARFRSAYQVMIRTIDRAYGELEKLSFERHGQYVKRLQSLVTDWRADFPDEQLEWL
jgi:ParB-like chromosome segregation protein Spo0J